MWGYEDEAQKDQEVINKAKAISEPEEEEIGFLWQKHGMLFFHALEESESQRHYVGVLRKNGKQFSRGNLKALLQGAKIKVRYLKGVTSEE